jgi:hypothetical protein
MSARWRMPFTVESQWFPSGRSRGGFPSRNLPDSPQLPIRAP